VTGGVFDTGVACETSGLAADAEAPDVAWDFLACETVDDDLVDMTVLLRFAASDFAVKRTVLSNRLKS
jgi:hypothetical protein